jgi:superfamily II DNA/RNA helicase
LKLKYVEALSDFAFNYNLRRYDMGFEPQLRAIVEQSDLPRREHRQTLLFSATFPPPLQAGAYTRSRQSSP